MNERLTYLAAAFQNAQSAAHYAICAEGIAQHSADAIHDRADKLARDLRENDGNRVVDTRRTICRAAFGLWNDAMRLPYSAAKADVVHASHVLYTWADQNAR